MDAVPREGNGIVGGKLQRGLWWREEMRGEFLRYWEFLGGNRGREFCIRWGGWWSDGFSGGGWVYTPMVGRYLTFYILGCHA